MTANSLNGHGSHALFSGSGLPKHGVTMAALVEQILAQCLTLRATPLNDEQKSCLNHLESAAHSMQSALSFNDAPHGPAAGETPAIRHASGLPPLRLLLAEDNLLTQKLMVRMLELRGHTVDVVDNGIQALEAAAKTDYDLLLMDVRMPLLDGIEATRAIREQERALHLNYLPILALTVLTGEEDRERFMAAGMDGFHGKPVKADLLFAEMEKILHTHRRTVPASRPPERAGRLETLEHLSRSVDGDVTLVREVVNLFFTQSQEQLEKIRQAIQGSLPAMLMEAAHSLKGASGAFGPSLIHQLSYQLEMAGRSGNLEQAPTALAELEREIQETEKALIKALDQGEFHV